MSVVPSIAKLACHQLSVHHVLHQHTSMETCVLSAKAKLLTVLHAPIQHTVPVAICHTTYHLTISRVSPALLPVRHVTHLNAPAVNSATM